ncbi:MAG: phenylacetate--CoA ligase family protein [Pseudomonadota bacterium]
MNTVRYRLPDALSRASAPAWSEVERAPDPEIRQIQEARLARQMRWLEARSPFYQRKLSRAGLCFGDVKTVENLARLPFTDKSELRESLRAAPPFGQHLAADPADVIQMQASSGTTGSPSYVALTESDAASWHEMTARCLFACGIRPGDSVLHAFAMAKGFVGGIPMLQGLQYMGALDIPIGADGGVDRLLRAAADLRPRCVLGAPNFVAHLAEKCEEITGIPARELGVERIVVGGEPGGGIPAVRAHIESLWGAKCCELLGGTDLAVTYWAECDAQAGMHMVARDHILTELLDPDTGEIIPFETGATGELVYTALTRQASPLLRFRSGDHVEVLGTSCACGRTGPRIRCVGRTDDMLIVRGVNVFPSAIRSIVTDMTPMTSGVMRVIADFEGHTTQSPLKVWVERGPGRPPEGDAELKQTVERRLRDALAFRAEVTIVPADFFDKPGAAKVALTLREEPRLP